MENDVIEPVPIRGEGIGNRIGLVADQYGTRTEAAAAAGVSVISLRRYIAEEQAPPFQVLARLAMPKGVSLEWVATGKGEMFLDGTPGKLDSDAVPVNSCSCTDTLGNPVDLEEFVFIPRYNLKAAAGHGAAVAGEKPMFSMSFRRYWIDNFLRIDPKDLSVLSVKGDSMEGVLNDRDVILVNHADTSPTTGLYVLRIEGDLLVKRVQKLIGGRLKILSANESYEPFEVDTNNPGGDFAVVGRVVWFGRQL